MASVNLARGQRVWIDPQSRGGALDRLRAATAQCHHRLEQRLDAGRRFSGVASYRAYLEVMFGFHAPFEQSMLGHAVRRVITDYDRRCKTRLLAADLTALGLAPGALGALPRCPRVPYCADEAAAVGCLYVLEGATLGGQILLRLAEQRLQLTPQCGASYLASYGPDVRTMWQRFGAAAEAWCTDEARRAAAAAAAVSTFESLETWLCGAPA